MEDTISRHEHEEFRKAIDARFQRVDDEDRRQNRRIDLMEESSRQIATLTASVQKLADNMESMLKVQNKQGDRLEELEGRDGKMWRKAVEYAACAVIGILIGYIFTKIGL